MRTNQTSQTKPLNQPDAFQDIKKYTHLLQSFSKKGGDDKKASGVAELLKLNSEFNLKNGKPS